MTNIITFIFAYIGIGIVVEMVEEWFCCRFAKEWFLNPDDIELPKFDPIGERFNKYSKEQLFQDIYDVLTWPFGIVYWLRGIAKAKKEKIDPEEYFK